MSEASDAHGSTHYSNKNTAQKIEKSASVNQNLKKIGKLQKNHHKSPQEPLQFRKTKMLKEIRELKKSFKKCQESKKKFKEEVKFLRKI